MKIKILKITIIIIILLIIGSISNLSAETINNPYDEVTEEGKYLEFELQLNIQENLEDIQEILSETMYYKYPWEEESEPYSVYLIESLYEIDIEKEEKEEKLNLIQEEIKNITYDGEYDNNDLIDYLKGTDDIYDGYEPEPGVCEEFEYDYVTHRNYDDGIEEYWYQYACSGEPELWEDENNYYIDIEGLSMEMCNEEEGYSYVGSPPPDHSIMEFDKDNNDLYHLWEGELIEEGKKGAIDKIRKTVNNNMLVLLGAVSACILFLGLFKFIRGRD